MSKYTAEDFANAAFAELPKYGIRAHKSAGNSFWQRDGITRTTDEEMADAGWVPAPAPGRGQELTESELDAAQERAGIPNHPAGRKLAVELGRVIVPDPDSEPTNAEKLETRLLDLLGVVEAIGNVGVHNMAYELDRAGVKAPGDAGE